MKTDSASFNSEEMNLITLAQEYSDEGKARELIEGWRWPNGVVCPHCEAIGAYKLTFAPHSGNPVDKGVWKCKACRKKFTVRVGTIFEDSHIPLSKWLMAFFLMSASKKGISAHQLHRMLKITYKSAWFMCHRIRHAMDKGPLAEMLKGTVEADETYVGGKPRHGTGPHKRGRGTKKAPVVALIERNGDVRTKVVAGVSHKNLRQFIDQNVDTSAIVNTDEFPTYPGLLKNHARHDIVNHKAKEYARHNADGTVSHTNTCESFFSLIKRGVYGAFHHVSKEHLPKYCDEFAFRWNNRKLNDGERMKVAICQTEGKRLMYRDSSSFGAI